MRGELLSLKIGVFIVYPLPKHLYPSPAQQVLQSPEIIIEREKSIPPDCIHT